MPAAWTEGDIAFAQQHWKSMSKSDIARALGKSLDAVTHYAYRHGWSRHTPAPTYEHLTEAEKAYIAGIVDGEGHIEIGIGKATRTGSSRYSVAVVIANTDYELLAWVREHLPGGYVREKTWHGVKAHWKKQWFFRLDRRGSVLSLLTLLRPYLIVKRQRADEAIEAIQSIRAPQWR